MKVILINNLYPPYAVGGAERVVQERAEDYTAQGHQVRIITIHPGRGWGSWRPEKGVDGAVIIYRFYPPNIFSYLDLSKHGFFLKLIWHFIDIFNFWSTRIVRQILEAEKPDLVETHNLIGLGCRNLKFKISNLEFHWIHYLHDVQLVEPSGVLPWYHKIDSWSQKLYSGIIKKQMGDPELVISPSEFLKDFYQSRGFFKSSEFRVQSSQIVIEKNEKEDNFEPRTLNQELRFLFVGSLVEHKGIQVLMQAWDEVMRNPPFRRAGGERGTGNGELSIVGDGVLRGEVDDWAKNHPEVKVYGRLEGDDLQQIYADSDVLVFTSICLENRPTVIVEALERGLSVIASDTGGVRELVDEENLVEPENVEELAKALSLYY